MTVDEIMFANEVVAQITNGNYKHAAQTLAGLPPHKAAQIAVKVAFSLSPIQGSRLLAALGDMDEGGPGSDV